MQVDFYLFGDNAQKEQVANWLKLQKNGFWLSLAEIFVAFLKTKKYNYVAIL